MQHYKIQSSENTISSLQVFMSICLGCSEHNQPAYASRFANINKLLKHSFEEKCCKQTPQQASTLCFALCATGLEFVGNLRNGRESERPMEKSFPRTCLSSSVKPEPLTEQAMTLMRQHYQYQ